MQESKQPTDTEAVMHKNKSVDIQEVVLTLYLNKNQSQRTTEHESENKRSHLINHPAQPNVMIILQEQNEKQKALNKTIKNRKNGLE